MIRTKGEAGTGDVIEAVRHMQTVNAEIARASSASDNDLRHMQTVNAEIARASSASDNDLRQMARELECDYALLKETARKGRLPVVNFAAALARVLP